ncbi:hypothetical protein P792_04740 [Asaia sp. SF2.1]|nr:hypothetical protein P792_04740 [Asaia sp. SF2.1]
MMDTAIFAVTPCFFQNKQSEIPADNTRIARSVERVASGTV